MCSMQAKKKPGRPKTNLSILVAMKIDVETLSMLDELCQDLASKRRDEGDTFGGRSHAIRKCIRHTYQTRPWRQGREV